MTDEVRDELEAAVDELLGTDTKTWKSISLFDTVTHIVARINSRVFVGLPLCACTVAFVLMTLLTISRPQRELPQKRHRLC